MAISFDRALGIHQHTVGIRTQRAEVLASNIANADTPQYKAQDIDFKQALANAQTRQGFAMASTNERHFNVNLPPTGELKYRVPNQPDTGDGNTVDMQVERNNYLQNALEHQASLTFLGSKFRGLTSAIKGE
ncbi:MULTISPECIES: flagellar basal body rod protein FlgB [Corallincola]|uniref:Flagellar basal body rod protein FlgB n=3 Tax=Corallincola TaxID=1775176 RepID=A0A368N221_9GAMM|nr:MULTISPECIES: flagellar basal body rod protein FlgB [Corallincola]RCU44597.1 flagellar basal body rod protein FlgB [Corallincola holothuriorum]TAA40342.1 flagellar basal body rod protein FlgB [Corallincola spongiicola]TCI05351.1 flagellar basal body rod protein FlgB [Corallincola luteus]